MFRCVASLLAHRSTLRNLLLLLFLLVYSEFSYLLLWNLCLEISHRNRKEDSFCATDFVDHSVDVVVAFKRLWSSDAAVIRFLEARKSVGATDLCWKNMWCLKQEQHFSCQRCQHRMKLNWNVQELLVISGRFTVILGCSIKGRAVWVNHAQLDGAMSTSGCVALRKSGPWIFLETWNRCSNPSGAGYIASSSWRHCYCCIIHVGRYCLLGGWLEMTRKLDPLGRCAQGNMMESHSLTLRCRVRGVQAVCKALEYSWELQKACWCLLCFRGPVFLDVRAFDPRNLSTLITK